MNRTCKGIERGGGGGTVMNRNQTEKGEVNDENGETKEKRREQG